MGLRYALRYDPKWVILANDDIYKIDEFEKLKRQLNKISHKYDIIFTKKPNIHHSMPMYIGNATFLTRLYHRLKGNFTKKQQDIFDRFSVDRFAISDDMNVFKSFLYKFFYKRELKFYNSGDFVVLNPQFIRKKKSVF